MEDLTISGGALARLLGAADADAALLYLYTRTAQPYDRLRAAEALHMTAARLDRAEDLLRQLDLLAAPSRAPEAPQPTYSESDVTAFLQQDAQFSLLVGEAQRRLGRVLSTENLKTLLAIYDYLGLPMEVIGLLIGSCIQKAQARGNTNPPTMRAIEREAAQWARDGIDTIQQAADYVRRQRERLTRFGQFRQAMGLSGKLSGAEERYLEAWVEMGFDESAISLAYERTRLSTGTLKWPYMNKILQDWHAQGLHTAAEAATESRRAPGGQTPDRQTDGQRSQPGQSERQAVAQLQKGTFREE